MIKRAKKDEREMVTLDRRWESERKRRERKGRCDCFERFRLVRWSIMHKLIKSHVII